MKEQRAAAATTMFSGDCTSSKTHLQPTYALSTVISDDVHLRRDDHGEEDISPFQLDEERLTELAPAIVQPPG